MKVLFAIPHIINNSDYLTHLLEHLLVTSIQSNPNYLFAYGLDINAESDQYNVSLNFSNLDDISEIQLIVNEITLNTDLITSEIKSIAQEYKGYQETCRTKIMRIMGKTLYGRKFHYGKTQNISHQIIKDVFKQYVKLDNSIIIDNYYNILYIGSEIGSYIYTINDSTLSDRNSTIIKIKEGKFITFRCKADFSSILLVTFLEFLFDHYSLYTRRIRNGEYFAPTSYKHHFKDFSLFICPIELWSEGINGLKLNDAILETAKKGFMSSIKNGNYKGCIADFLTLYGYHFQLEDIDNFITTITLETITSID